MMKAERIAQRPRAHAVGIEGTQVFSGLACQHIVVCCDARNASAGRLLRHGEHLISAVFVAGRPRTEAAGGGACPFALERTETLKLIGPDEIWFQVHHHRCLYSSSVQPVHPFRIGQSDI